MMRRPARSTRTATLVPDTTVFRSTGGRGARLSGRRARARVVRADRKRADRSGGRGRAQHRDHGECAGRGGKRAAAVGADGAAAGAGGAARGCERRGLMGWALVAAAEPHHRKAWLKRFDPRLWTVDFARTMMGSG